MVGGFSRTCLRVAAAALAVALAVIGTGVAQAQPPAGVTMRVAVTQEIDSLNPFSAVFLTSTQINRLMYEYLTVAGPDNAVQPGLAESWKSSDDKLTWTFAIRDAKWSDGQPITAKDVAFTYNQIMTNPAAQTANGSAVANYASVTATDDRTLVIRTKAPQSSILNSEIPIVPEHVWSPLVAQIDKFPNADAAVGSGPFVLAGWDKQSQTVTLKANDRFWRGRPKVDTLQFVKYDNTDAAVQALIKGDIDLVRDTTPAQFASLKSNPAITLNEGRNRRYTELLLNWSNPDGTTGKPLGDGNKALRDVRVRQALSYAIDITTIVDKVKQGHAEPAYGVIPPVYPDWTFTPTAAEKRGYDPAKAKALLDAAGYKAGPDGKRVGPDGKPLVLRLVAATDAATNRQITDYLTSWFSAVGVGLDAKFESSNQADDDMVAGNFDIGFSGWSVNPDPDPTLAQQTCRMNGTENSDSGYCNPAYDALYAQQQAELDKGRRQQLVTQMQTMLYDDVHAIILTNDKLLEAYRGDRFTGFVTQPKDGGVITGQTGYWGYYSATPVTAAAPGGAGGGSTGWVVGGVVAAVVVIGAVAFFVVRGRRRTSDERE